MTVVFVKAVVLGRGIEFETNVETVLFGIGFSGDDITGVGFVQEVCRLLSLTTEETDNGGNDTGKFTLCPRLVCSFNWCDRKCKNKSCEV